MIKTTYFNTIILSLLLFCNSIFSQTISISEAKNIKKIETYLGKLEKVGFSGSLLVEQNGQKLISKGYGFRDVQKKLKNTSNTVFDIGSITKQFTAAAILKLEMKGKLHIEDKISKYFSNVPSDKSEITIHDLLRHQSGLPSVIGDDYEAITESEFIEKVWKTPLRFTNGSRFSYSNVGYSLLGMIIERVSGENYEKFLYENLWKPAEMEMTGYTRPNFDKNLIAIGYQNDDEWGKPIDKSWDKDAPFWHLKANGGILSTAEDLYKWHLALLSNKILSKEAKQKYFQPKLREGETLDSYYAYGWDVHKTKYGTTIIQHNGSNGVFYADFHRYIDDKLTIIMLSNKSQRSLNNVPFEISRIFFEPQFIPIIPIAENKANREFTNKIIEVIIEKGFNEGAKVYQNRNRNIDLIEHLVNSKGYQLLSDKKIEKSIEIFRLNVMAFPKSANAYDSLGEAYFENKNYDLSLANYKKAFELDSQNNYAQEMIKNITEMMKDKK